MLHTQETIEDTLSPKHQITIPAAFRDALGLRPVDKIEFRLQMGNVLELRVKRPKPSETIATILEQFDVSTLQVETKNDAVAAVRESRCDAVPLNEDL
jgi:AbrB family looped-hinge helix DNA binding protein